MWKMEQVIPVTEITRQQRIYRMQEYKGRDQQSAYNRQQWVTAGNSGNSRQQRVTADNSG